MTKSFKPIFAYSGEAGHLFRTMPAINSDSCRPSIFTITNRITARLTRLPVPLRSTADRH